MEPNVESRMYGSINYASWTCFSVTGKDMKAGLHPHTSQGCCAPEVIHCHSGWKLFVLPASLLVQSVTEAFNCNQSCQAKPCHRNTLTDWTYTEQQRAALTNSRVSYRFVNIGCPKDKLNHLISQPAWSCSSRKSLPFWGTTSQVWAFLLSAWRNRDCGFLEPAKNSPWELAEVLN